MRIDAIMDTDALSRTSAVIMRGKGRSASMPP
jgi:hypothetical protein